MGQLELRLLLQGGVRARRVGGEGMLDILLVGLGDAGGQGLESLDGVIRDGQGDLLLGLQSRGERDLVVLSRTGRVHRGDLGGEALPVGILLVLGHQAANALNDVSLKRDVVLGLGAGIDVLDDDVDGLAGVVLLEVDVAHEIDVAEVLRRGEGRVEEVLGVVGGVGVGGGGGEDCRAQQSPGQ